MPLRPHLRVARSMAAPATWLLVGAVAARLAALAATIAISRILSPNAFGELALVQTVITLAAGIGGLGLGVSITRRVAETRLVEPVLAGRYLGWTLSITISLSLLVAVVYAVAAHPVAAVMLDSSHRANFVFASAAAVPGTAVLTAVQGGLMGLQAFRRTALSLAAQGLGQAAGLILGAAVGGSVAALIGFSVGTVAAAVWSCWLLWRETGATGITLARGGDGFDPRPMWTIGMPAFLAFLALYAALLGGQLLLSRHAHGYEQVALFNVAYRWHLGLLFIPASIAPALMPMMTNLQSAGESMDARRLFALNIGLALLLTCVPAAVMALLSSFVMGFSGSYYAHHSGSLIILAAAAIPGALNNVLSSAGISLDAVRAWLISDVALAVAFFGAALGLIPSLGAVGLAWAYLIGYVVTDATLVLPVKTRLERLHTAPPAPIPEARL